MPSGSFILSLREPTDNDRPNKRRTRLYRRKPADTRVHKLCNHNPIKQTRIGPNLRSHVSCKDCTIPSRAMSTTTSLNKSVMMNKCAETPTTSPPAPEDKQASSQQQLLKEEYTATLTQPCNNEDEDKTNENVSREDSTVEAPRAKSPSSLHPNKQRAQSSHLLFPSRLRRLLDDAEAENNQHIISWLPNGKAFKVYDPVAFSAKLLKRYFRQQTQFESFTRQLYNYGFGKVDTVTERGAFYHPRFQRDNIDCCISLDRKTARAHINTVHNRLVRVLTDGVYRQGGGLTYRFPDKKKPSCGPVSTQKLQGLSGNTNHHEGSAASTTEEETPIEDAEARALLAYGFLKLKDPDQVAEQTMLESSFTAYLGLKDSGSFTGQPHPRINNVSCCSAPPHKEQEHDTKDWFSNIEERFSELDDHSSWVAHTILSEESAPRTQLLEPRSLKAMTLYPDLKLFAATTPHSSSVEKRAPPRPSNHAHPCVPCT